MMDGSPTDVLSVPAFRPWQRPAHETGALALEHLGKGLVVGHLVRAQAKPRGINPGRVHDSAPG